VGKASNTSFSKVDPLWLPPKIRLFADAYTLNWNVDSDVVKDAAYVTIKGTGISDVKQDATGKVVVNALGLSGRCGGSDFGKLKLFAESF